MGNILFEREKKLNQSVSKKLLRTKNFIKRLHPCQTREKLKTESPLS